MDISIIVVNWNTKDLLKKCLSSIFKNTKGISFEVIVVDNASADSSTAMVKAVFPKVRLIKNQKNLGFAKANNQGIKVASGRYIFLLNSDAYLIENSFKKLVEFADKKSDVSILGPLLLNEDRTIQQSVGYFPHIPQIFWWMSFLDDLPGGELLEPYHVDHDRFYKKGREVDWVTGAALMARREVLDKVGLLDERIFMYGEDLEFCFRAKANGFRVFFEPMTKIVHIGRGSVKKTAINAILGEYRGLMYFYQKYKKGWRQKLLSFFLKAGAFSRMIIFGLILGRRDLLDAYHKAFKLV